MTKKKKIIWVTSREVGIAAAFSAVGFTWSALGLSITFFPPAQWSLSFPLAQIGCMAAGPIAAIILGFIAGLTSHTMITDLFEGIFTMGFLTALYYWPIRKVIKPIRYPMIFIMTFLINQLDAYIWSLWSAHFYLWIAPETILPITAACLIPWSALNAITVTAFVILADKFAPGFMMPTWLDRWTGKIS